MCEHPVTIADKTRLSVSVRDTNLELQASGIAEVVAEIGEQLAWICCALQSHPLDGIARCIPSAIALDSSLSPPSVKIKISRELQRDNTSSDNNGSCWKHLFRNPVLVEGYPIQRRPALGTGLELSLATLADLVQCKRMTVFKDEIFLKGFCSMLVAVQLFDDVVHWHAYTNENGSYINYYDRKEPKETVDLKLMSHLNDFTSMRHIVGWSSRVQDHSGRFESLFATLKLNLRLTFNRLGQCQLQNPGFGSHETSGPSNRLRKSKFGLFEVCVCQRLCCLGGPGQAGPSSRKSALY